MDREPLRGKIRAKGSSGQTDLRGLRADHGDQTLPGGMVEGEESDKSRV